jgi:hypothetical protein
VTLLLRTAAALALAVAGAGTGIAAVAVHTEAWGWPLGVTATSATATALPGTWWGRFPFCLAWAGLVLSLSLARAEGDFVISSDLPGYALIAVALVLGVMGVVGLVPGRGRADTGSAPTPT